MLNGWFWCRRATNTIFCGSCHDHNSPLSSRHRRLERHRRERCPLSVPQGLASLVPPSSRPPLESWRAALLRRPPLSFSVCLKTWQPGAGHPPHCLFPWKPVRHHFQHIRVLRPSKQDPCPAAPALTPIFAPEHWRASASESQAPVLLPGRRNLRPKPAA